MIIGGFQKMTVLDYPGHIACTVFMYGCNLRCPFCHNARLVTDTVQPYQTDDVLAYLGRRIGVLDGVCVSGGEPLLQPDIMDFLFRIKEMGLKVKLDTNGTLPDRLRTVITRELVDYVAMDIKNARKKYPLTVGYQKLDISPVEKSVSLLLEECVDYEFRTTVVREYHTMEDILSIGAWIRGARRYFLQQFEDTGHLLGETLLKEKLHAYEPAVLREFSNAVKPFVSESSVRGI